MVAVVSFLARVAFVATLVWTVVVGGVAPAILVWLVYGRFAGIVAGLAGGVLGFMVHRYAWSDYPPAGPPARAGRASR